jgi:hypothetical protein
MKVSSCAAGSVAAGSCWMWLSWCVRLTIDVALGLLSAFCCIDDMFCRVLVCRDDVAVLAAATRLGACRDSISAFENIH